MRLNINTDKISNVIHHTCTKARNDNLELGAGVEVVITAAFKELIRQLETHEHFSEDV
jgi:hypothetical protein